MTKNCKKCRYIAPVSVKKKSGWCALLRKYVKIRKPCEEYAR